MDGHVDRQPPAQLPLELPIAPSLGREDFLAAPCNRAAAAAIDQWPDWSDPFLMLLGPPGSGKSHLCAIWAQKAECAGGRAGRRSLARKPRGGGPARDRRRWGRLRGGRDGPVPPAQFRQGERRLRADERPPAAARRRNPPAGFIVTIASRAHDRNRRPGRRSHPGGARKAVSRPAARRRRVLARLRRLAARTVAGRGARFCAGTRPRRRWRAGGG